MGRAKTHIEFVRELKAISPTITVKGQYQRSNKKLEFLCNQCGHSWEAVPGSLLQGHGCPNCARIANGNRKRKTHSQLIEELKIKNPDIEVVGQYRNSSSPIEVRCRKCGYEWAPTAASIVNSGQGCPVCRRKEAVKARTKTHESFVQELNEKNPWIAVQSKYETSHKKVKCECLRCGNQWDAAPSNLLHGYGCPQCAKTGTSYMEQYLLVCLQTAFGKNEVLSRDKKLIGSELDIYIPSKRFAIEIGSWYWHKHRLESDARKAKKCAEAGVRLLTIYDGFPNDPNASLPKDCLTFHQSLSDVRSYPELNRLASSILQSLGYSRCEELNWAAIEDQAARQSVKLSTEEFVNAMARISPDVEVLGPYTGAKKHIKCRCRTCGREWQPTAQQLLLGSGCPICRRKAATTEFNKRKKLTPAEYASRLKEVNPNLIPLSPYKGSLDPIRVRCQICGYEWLPRAETLISRKHRTSCPACSNRKRTKTQQEFESQLCLVNKDIEVLGRYIKNSVPIECRCRKCGHIWSPRPSKLLSGQGCPKCSGRSHPAIRCIETGQVYESYAAAAKAIGLSTGDPISMACRGKRELAGGYRWEFA